MSANGGAYEIPSSNVRAVQRAIELIVCVAEQQGSTTLQQLADRLGYSKSTVHRLLSTLENLEIVERDRQSRQYRLGRRITNLARESRANVDPRRLSLPHMLELRDACDETVTLHWLDRDAHVVVEQCESPQEIRRILPLGQRIPLLTGATAKAILAFLTPEDGERILATNRAPDDVGPSRQELQDIRALGYAFSLSERVAGGSAISAPIIGGHGVVWGALSVSGPSFRFSAARAARCAPLLIRAAEQISAALGHVAIERDAGRQPDTLEESAWQLPHRTLP